jgi:arylsulfatase A-like enzyme
LHKPSFFDSAGPFRGTKRDVYEGGIRVPLLAQWPGSIAAGSVSDTPCAFWDLLPTAAELAGLPAPKSTDGISLVPSLLGQTRREHEYLYWDYGHVRERFLQAVRRGQWKAVRNGSSAPIELYDLATDIGEKSDVAASHPKIVAELQKIMTDAVTPSPDYPIRDRGGK